MTDRLSTLTRLRDMVRNADGPSDEIDHELWWQWGGDAPPFSYAASLGEAIVLAEKELPSCEIDVLGGRRPAAHIKWEGLEAAAYGNTRPLAILDCLLSVLIEKEERG